jgi:hypothetical protein
MLLGVSTGLVLSLGLAGCGSSGNGRGEKVMDLGDFGGVPFSIAASDQGSVTVVAADDWLEVSDLRPNSWSWSKPERVAPAGDLDIRDPDPLAAAYDGSGRLLVAWTIALGTKHPRIGFEERLRAADGKWQPADRPTAKEGSAGCRRCGAHTCWR